MNTIKLDIAEKLISLKRKREELLKDKSEISLKIQVVNENIKKLNREKMSIAQYNALRKAQRARKVQIGENKNKQ